MGIEGFLGLDESGDEPADRRGHALCSTDGLIVLGEEDPVDSLMADVQAGESHNQLESVFNGEECPQSESNGEIDRWMSLS